MQYEIERITHDLYNKRPIPAEDVAKLLQYLNLFTDQSREVEQLRDNNDKLQDRLLEAEGEVAELTDALSKAIVPGEVA